METCNIYKTPEQPVSISHVLVHDDLLLMQEKMNYLFLKNKGKVKSGKSEVAEYSKSVHVCNGKSY